MNTSMEVEVEVEVEVDESESDAGSGSRGTASMDESFHDAMEQAMNAAGDEGEGEGEGGDGGGGEEDSYKLDCYPYTFTPMLLFAQSSYFDKGHSNYNSVARFFDPITAPLGVRMLENVICDRKNMLYEALIEHVIQTEALVICCIDAHFTALQVMNIGSGSGSSNSTRTSSKPSGVYYDPLKSTLSRLTGDSFKLLLAFLLLKCNYGDSQHIQDNADHYTSVTANQTRRTIYKLWRKINLTPNAGYLAGVSWGKAPLNLDRYLLVNDSRNPKLMSVQLTGNTCYFQSYLFALLCKVGGATTARDGKSVDVSSANADKLQQVTTHVARHLLEFFSEMDSTGETILRPLTNTNFVLDFYRYRTAPYHSTMTSYLQHLHQRVPDYERQYHEVTRYYWNKKILHKYERFTDTGPMTSTPNTKSLQHVTGTEGALHKLARSDYYKYRAANFMFGWNSSILHSLDTFCEFNALRKNQLLHFYEQIKPHLEGLVESFRKAKKGTKYRDFYFLPAYECSQKELVDIHHYTFLIDFCALSNKEGEWTKRVHAINELLAEHIFYSTQKRHNYEKFVTTDAFRKSKKTYRFFLDTFMSTDFLSDYIALGFSDINPKEKEINSLTQTVFYTTELMRQQAHRQEVSVAIVGVGVGVLVRGL
jgi:hypothetical protein